VFSQVDKYGCILYVPKGSKDAYKAANQWKDFTKIEEMSTTDTKIVDENELCLFPNPVKDGFRVSGITGKSTLIIYDMNGRLLLGKEIENNEYISVSSFPRGIFLVKTNSSGNSLEKKMIKR
jgi:hypothetical protein